VREDGNGTGSSQALESGAAAPHSKTLAREPGASWFRQVLECVGAPALFGKPVQRAGVEELMPR